MINGHMWLGLVACMVTLGGETIKQIVKVIVIVVIVIVIVIGTQTTA